LALVQVGLLGVTLFSGLKVEVVQAAAPGVVVINEVAWAGSADSANDEWMELYNTTGAAVDLSGWKIKDDGAVAFTFPAGSGIAAHGYALIEDAETAVSNVPADFIYNMSLANSGDSLQLLDASDQVIDVVNGSGGSWYAGSSVTFASMERKDALGGDLEGNFAASTGGTGALGSAGSILTGTPRQINSGSVVPVDQPRITAGFEPAEVTEGQVVVLKVKAVNVSDLFAYGYELVYDPAVLQFQSVVPGTFLSEAGAVDTSFQSGLKAGQEGRLLVAEARTVDPKTGYSGSGEMFEVNFRVLAGAGTATTVNFDPVSFSSSVAGDLTLPMLPAGLTIGLSSLQPVTGLQAAEGSGRYQIRLNWTASASAPDHYRVERKNAHGEWVILAGVSATEFVDQDGVTGGGNIIPDLAYNYRITAVKGTVTSVPVEITAQDSRGLRGDNNRSDLVEGRDLERLARHFAETDQSAGYDWLVDTNYDGLVNGSDLIDIGANFAQSFS
jgi:hypothetical protein